MANPPRTHTGDQCPACRGTGHLPDVTVNACQTDPRTPEAAEAIDQILAYMKRKVAPCMVCMATGRITGDRPGGGD